jgi:hypothetical protein
MEFSVQVSAAPWRGWLRDGNATPRSFPRTKSIISAQRWLSLNCRPCSGILMNHARNRPLRKDPRAPRRIDHTGIHAFRSAFLDHPGMWFARQSQVLRFRDRIAALRE